MPTELEELVEFMHHGNTQIRQIALENLVGYSISQPDIFKTGQLTPIKDLKLLVKDYTPIAKNAITILINLSSDEEVLKTLVSDEDFVKLLISKIAAYNEPNADLLAMLLANLAKNDDIKKLFTLQLDPPKKPPEPKEGQRPQAQLTTSKNALDQLMDCFVKGADGSYNAKANYDYLAYLFADLAKFPEGRKYFVAEQEYDHVIPISKLVVFTEHGSDVRRKGVASTIKNVAFQIESHPLLLSEDEVDLLPYLLLPLTGPEEYSEEDSASFPIALQLLPDTKRRDTDHSIIQTHLETLMILTHTRPGRDKMREIGVYPIIRETHLHVDNDDVCDACDRLVQVIMRDEAPDEAADEPQEQELEDSDEETKLVPIP